MKSKIMAIGEAALVQALRDQHLVGGDELVAKKLHRLGIRRDFIPGEFLAREDDPDTDIFFIIDGQVSILIKGREIGLIRGKREHVGEMAGLDSSRRSACVKAIKPTTVVSLQWEHFVAIADEHPKVWRGIALPLSVRLRERSQFIRRPNPCPVVFIGSSKESLSIAKTLAQRIKKKSCVECNLWTEPSIFAPSKTTIESLVEASQNADCAVLVFGPDDTVRSRKRQSKAPRDNVLFELGLFMGAIGRDRTFFVCPRGNQLKIPSDLLGVTPLSFELVRNKPDMTAVAKLGSRIREIAVALKPR